MSAPDRDAACDLLEGLVAIPSLSGQERAAAEWLVARMLELGFERAGVDAAGNAVGEMGDPGGRLVVLLGHIDTVSGAVAVRREHDRVRGELLYGRGSVDAKGPLAAFVAGAARFGSCNARERGLHLVVAGAVEEEAATSRGARFLARRFDGTSEPLPHACIIGEPSRWDRVTLGYKGRFLAELSAEREMSHTAGPEPGVAVVAVGLWNTLVAVAAAFNEGRDRAFDQLLPSLRGIRTDSDGLVERVTATLAARLPPGFDLDSCIEALAAELAAHADAVVRRAGDLGPEQGLELSVASPRLSADLRIHGVEQAHRAARGGPLPAAFLSAIRSVGDEAARPAFVLKTGTSDMNVVAPLWRCPILAYGPGDSALDHTPHEHIELDELWRAVRVVEEALGRL